MSRAVCLALLVAVGCSVKPAPDAGFAGTWVMNVDHRPFIVLTLKPEDGGYVGTLERPRHLTTTADGRTFSGIGPELTTSRITARAPKQGVLRIESEAAKGADKDEFDFSLTADGEGRLKFSDAPFEPWPMTRNTSGGSPRVWTGWDSRRSYALDEPYVEPNAEMAAIYKADQAPRQSLESFYANATQIDKEDAIRRERARALIDTGQLNAAEDFRLAALVFQHGSEPRDYLFAHTLALIALEKGDRAASWIAAASLDRYLRSIDRPQVFGLQFERNGIDRQTLDSELVSDALRKELGIPTLAEQTAQMQRVTGK